MWELESEQQLHLLLSCAAMNCIPHQSTAGLTSHGSSCWLSGGSGGWGGACETLALDKIAQHNPQTDAQLWLKENKASHSIFQQNKVRQLK